MIDLFESKPLSIAPQNVTDKAFLAMEIQRWKTSPERLMQLTGERYYHGDHDILKRRREVIGADGALVAVSNLPNNRIVDNQYGKMVDQKANFLLSKPLTFETGNEADDTLLQEVFNDKFLMLLKRGGIDAYNGGLFWIYVYYDQEGKLAFQRFKPYEILPFWKDSEHTDLDCAVRLYQVEGFEGSLPKVYEKVEVYTKSGVLRYDYTGGVLIEDTEAPLSSYLYVGDKGYNWEHLPLIPFKSNGSEIPLIKKLKSLQDSLNLMRSELINRMQEDAHNTVLVVKNYDGQDLGEFRQNLATFGVVKVRCEEGENGGVDTLQVEVNAQNYELVFNTLKKAIIENAMGYDAKDDRLGSNANTMNLRSMYSDIDLDADNMENEFQSSFKQLMFFVNSYLGKDLEPKITFNRDIMVNETEVIDNVVKLRGLVSDKDLLAQIPFIDDPAAALANLEQQQQKELDAQRAVYEDTMTGGNKSAKFEE